MLPDYIFLFLRTPHIFLAGLRTRPKGPIAGVFYPAENNIDLLNVRTRPVRGECLDAPGAAANSVNRSSRFDNNGRISL